MSKHVMYMCECKQKMTKSILVFDWMKSGWCKKKFRINYFRSLFCFWSNINLSDKIKVDLIISVDDDIIFIDFFNKQQQQQNFWGYKYFFFLLLDIDFHGWFVFFRFSLPSFWYSIFFGSYTQKLFQLFSSKKLHASNDGKIFFFFKQKNQTKRYNKPEK